MTCSACGAEVQVVVVWDLSVSGDWPARLDPIRRYCADCSRCGMCGGQVAPGDGVPRLVRGRMPALHFDCLSWAERTLGRRG